MVLAILLHAACSASPREELDAACDGCGGRKDDGFADAAEASTRQPSLLHTQLGRLTTDANGRATALAVEMPAGATALTLVLAGPPDVWLQVAGLTRSSPVALVPPSWLGLTDDPRVCLGPCINRIVARAERAAFLFPNTPQVALLPGQMSLQIHSFRWEGGEATPVAAEVDVSAWWVRSPAAQRRALRVNVVVTGAGGLQAPHALQDPDLAAALAELQERLATAGIEVAVQGAFEVDHALAFVLDREGSDSDLERLWAAGADLPVGINVFVVDTIARSSGTGPPGMDVLLGLAAGIPGDPLAVGKGRAGVVVAFDRDDPVKLGRVMAHEICHFLGLFHTSEPAKAGGAALGDPLPDTPVPDPSNLMHWAVGAATRALRHEQVQALHRSPWLYGESPDGR